MIDPTQEQVEAVARRFSARAAKGDESWWPSFTDQAELAIAALRPWMRGGWQSIDTAPRNGTRLIVHDPLYSESTICFWDEYADSWSEDDGTPLKPTHWQPLPLYRSADHD